MNDKFLLKVLKIKLKLIAKLTIWRFNPKIVAITGSAGKTSAKEAAYAVLKEHFRVRKSIGNFNNEIGVPLSIIGDWNDKDLEIVSLNHKSGTDKLKKLLFWMKAIFGGLFRFAFMKKDDYPEIIILEYGVEYPGDIKYLLHIAKPYVSVVTTVGEIPPHVEFFSSPEQLAREKSRLVESLPVASFAILNADDEIVSAMKNRTRASCITFGLGAKADLEIKNFANKMGGDFDHPEPQGLSFKIKYGGSIVPVFVNKALGRGQAYAAAAGACVGLVFGLNLVEIAEGLGDYVPREGRLNLLNGIKGTLVIDDTYNASPVSMAEALDILRELPHKRKIAVLGDMLELGEYTIEAHEKMGKLAAKSADILIAVGERSKFLATAAEKNGLKNKVYWFADAVEAGKKTQEIMKTGDALIVKASHSMHLEKIIDEIKLVG